MGRVLILGGHGLYGGIAALLLAQSEAVDELILGARNMAIASRAADALGDKARAVETDVLQPDSIDPLLEDADVLVNASGLYDVTGLAAIRAAIRTRTPVCDLADEWRVIEQAYGLDKDAREAGITAIVGAGLTPGSTAVLAKHAANQLDRADRLITTWLADFVTTPDEIREYARLVREEGRFAGAVEARIHAHTDLIRIYRDGQWNDIEPFSTSHRVTLRSGDHFALDPIGAGESITLPRAVPGVKSVSDYGGLYPPRVNDLLRTAARRVSSGEVDVKQANIDFMDTIAADPERWLERPGAANQSGAWGTAEGSKDGRKARCTVAFAGGYGDSDEASGGVATAGPLVVAAIELLEGRVDARGVVSVEGCFEPLRFVEALSRYWADIPEDGKLLKETWEWLD